MFIYLIMSSKAKKQQRFITKNVLMSPYNVKVKFVKADVTKAIFSNLAKYIETWGLKQLKQGNRQIINYKVLID